MEKKIIVTADSTCDLGEELKQRYGIVYTPLHVILDGQDYRDGVDVDPDRIYQVYREKKILPKTAAFNVQEYIDFFRPWTEQGYEVIHVNIGSALSSSYQNCCLAAEELPGVHPVDSASLSTGSGLMVLEIADRIAEGRSVEEILDEIPKIRANCHASFVIDTLDFLYKGGRCSALAMLGANLLQIKPSIEVSTQDGSMDVAKKYRGSLDKALSQYVRDKLSGRTDLKTHRIFITHSGISQERIDMVRELIGQYAQFDEILVTRAGCTISSHCGPNTLGILFMTKY